MMPAVIAVLSARDAFENDAAYLTFAEGRTQPYLNLTLTLAEVQPKYESNLILTLSIH